MLSTRGISKKKTIYCLARSDRINALRKQYDAFLEEDKKRKERNDFILGKLDKMRYTTALVRHKPNMLESHVSTMDRIGYHPEISPVRDLQPTLKNPNLVISNIAVRSTEDALIQEISKKYILIPKLRTTYTNNHNAIRNETASQIQNPEILSERHNKQDNVPIHDIKLNTNENGDWKDKYEILNILKNEEKEKRSGNTFTDYKEDPKLFARAESFLENRQVPIKYDMDRNEEMNVTEIPEKDLSNDKSYFGISNTNQQKLNAYQETSVIENVKLTTPDQSIAIDDKFKTMSLDDEQPVVNNSETSSGITNNYEPQPNINNSQSCEPPQQANNLTISQNDDPHEVTNINMLQSYELQDTDNLNSIQNYEPQDATDLSLIQDREPEDTANLSLSQYEPQPESNLNVTPAMTTNDGNHLNEENAYYHEEYFVQGDSNNIQNEMPAVQHDPSYSGDMVYTNSNEVGSMPIDHNITENLEITNNEITDVNYTEPNLQPEPIFRPTESVRDEPNPANEAAETQNEQTNNFAEMAESIQEFDIEQREMFYTESAEHNPSQKGEETTASEINSNEYQQNEEYNYYDNIQPEAYPVELQDEEMTQRYDPHYEEQYAGVEERVQGQEYQHYQASELVEQAEPQAEIVKRNETRNEKRH
ncbi:hypothetical protein HF086_014094 [Spodoptera exigua]|uniref:Uncharacterized protein n=1 Tax=Spodoptera exigua TaxID=7107 RepID=A0A922SIU6_SPOEX|nr:hypothetical protein HF086_014094 [Spodoptera exigua]